MPRRWQKCPHWFIWLHYQRQGLGIREIARKEDVNPGSILRGIRRASEELEGRSDLEDLMPTVRQLVSVGISRAGIEKQIARLLNK